MVAITVILAAVIGAFVLEIGNQGETAPNTSFSSEETQLYANTYTGSSGYKNNWTLVSISHAGGDVLAENQIGIGVNGNKSVLQNQGGSKEVIIEDQRQALDWVPTLAASRGQNDGRFESGESYYPLIYGGETTMGISAQSTPLPTRENAESGRWTAFIDHASPNAAVENRDTGGGFRFNVLCFGDTVSVIWTSESGGKNQQLFRTTVEQDGQLCQYY
jgi:hypothetical protein